MSTATTESPMARRRSQHLPRREFNFSWPFNLYPSVEASPPGRCERTSTFAHETMSIARITLILTMVMYSSCATNAKRQEAALETLGASRMYGDALRFGFLETGPPPKGVRKGESITELSLNSQRKLIDSDLRVLADLPALRELQLDHTNITDRSTVHLLGCRNLQVLGLREVNITDASLPHIAKLKQIRELDLWGTRVTSAGLRELSALRHLEKLWLHETKVSDDAVPILSRFKSLREVGLGGTRVTAGGKQELRRRCPGITIFPDDFKPSHSSSSDPFGTGG